jgi:hypothetical protein
VVRVFRVEGLGFMCSEFRVQGLGLRVDLVLIVYS